MKKCYLCIILCLCLVSSTLVGCGSRVESWLVTCPWAPSGVAAVVSNKVAELSSQYSDNITLVADAIKGDANTVNMWVNTTMENDCELVFAGEGLFAITNTLSPEKLEFTYDDFVFVENLYSSIFVMCASKELDVDSIASLEKYLKGGGKARVATNGATGSEAFLAAALFGAMGYSDQMELVSFSSAQEAADAVKRKEADFAISHQSQILSEYEKKTVNMVCAFSEDDIQQGSFKGLEGVGKHGYPYFMNRCFIMARAGTEASKVDEIKELYRQILNSPDITSWLNNEMLLEVDTMTEADVQAHITNVTNIVNQYKDIVVK